MANRKEIRTKISSTRKTKKITSAMKLVAAAKVSKIQKKLQVSRPYTNKISDLLANLLMSVSKDDLSEYPLLKSKAQIDKVLLVVHSSDRGLCAAYNTNIIKATTKRINELLKENKRVELVTIGRKATSAFSKTQWQEKGVKINKSFCNLESMPKISEANIITEHITKLFTESHTDKVEIIVTKFISMITNEIKISEFLPLTTNIPAKQIKSDPYVILDPDSAELINALVPMYLENSVYLNLIEAATSELASRMTAMTNATSNAEEVIKQLVLKSNKVRQASITQEISEIVAGSAAV